MRDPKYCSIHKTEGMCKKCTNKRTSSGICPHCGKKLYSAYCNKHRGNSKRGRGYKLLEPLVLTSDGLCGICKKEIDVQGLKFYITMMKEHKPNDKMQIRRRQIDVDVDHIIPLAKGGDNQRNNLQLTHRMCNQKKGDML